MSEAVRAKRRDLRLDGPPIFDRPPDRRARQLAHDGGANGRSRFSKSMAWWTVRSTACAEVSGQTLARVSSTRSERKRAPIFRAQSFSPRSLGRQIERRLGFSPDYACDRQRQQRYANG